MWASFGHPLGILRAFLGNSGQPLSILWESFGRLILVKIDHFVTVKILEAKEKHVFRMLAVIKILCKGYLPAHDQ